MGDEKCSRTCVEILAARSSKASLFYTSSSRGDPFSFVCERSLMLSTIYDSSGTAQCRFDAQVLKPSQSSLAYCSQSANTEKLLRQTVPFFQLSPSLFGKSKESSVNFTCALSGCVSGNNVPLTKLSSGKAWHVQLKLS